MGEASASFSAAERRLDVWAVSEAPGPFGAWWAAYVLQSIASMLAQRMLLGSKQISDLLVWSQAYMVAIAVSIVALVLAIAVVRQITTDQVRAGVG